MKRLFTDVFYNGNCYGSLYRREQKDENKRQPEVDLDHSVDRTYMTNRHQSQFIGKDLLSSFHFTVEECLSSKSESDSEIEYDLMDVPTIRYHQRMIALDDRKEKLVDAPYYDTKKKYMKNDVLGYREQLIKQTDQDSGVSVCRMLSAEDHFIDSPCLRPFGSNYTLDDVNDLIRVYNHLVFDFDTHRLSVNQIPENEANYSNSSSLPHRWIKLLKSSDKNSNPISYYRVNIEKLAEETEMYIVIFK